MSYKENIRDFYEVSYVVCRYCNEKLNSKLDFSLHLFVKHQKIWVKRCN